MTTTRIDRNLRIHASNAGWTRQERRWVCGGSSDHQVAVRAYNKAVRRYSKALCAMAVADYEIEVEEAREAAEQARLLAREDEIAAATGTLRLWHVSRTCRGGYDTYSDFVVAARTAEQAARIHPSEYSRWDRGTRRFVYRSADASPSEEDGYGSWTDAVDSLEVVCIGDAAEGVAPGKVLCASFHAG